MKKITLVSLISFLFLIISSLVAYFLRYIDGVNDKICLIIGVIILVLSGLIKLIFKRKKLISIFCLILSSIALGFMIRSWYIFRNFDNSLLVMLLVSLACIVHLWIFYLLLYIPFIDKHYVAYTIIFIIASIIVYLFVMGFSQTTYISTFGYYMIVEMSFVIGLCMSSRTYTDLINNMSICSYSVFIVAVVIAILMIAGDGADFDFSFDLGGGDSLSDKKSPKDKKVINDFEKRI